MDFKAPLSVSFCGCGRWNTARTPFKAIRTLEPLPSLISAPAALSKASMLVHSMLAFTGSAKISLSVFWCVLFNFIWYRFIVSLGSDGKHRLPWNMLVQTRHMGEQAINFLGPPPLGFLDARGAWAR